MNIRTIVLLLDIDNTLIDFNASIYDILWNASLELWQKYLTLLQEAIRAANMEIQIGIATFKDESVKSWDALSATVLEEKNPQFDWIKAGCGLRKWINPELEYYTSGNCKVENALDKVRAKYPGILPEDIFIVDDTKEYVCDVAEQKGYSAICVGDDLNKLTKNGRSSRIAKAFEKIFLKLKLPVPDEIAAQAKEPETTIAEMAQLIRNRNAQVSTQPNVTVPSNEDLIAKGMQGLKVDESAADHHLNKKLGMLNNS